MVSINFRLTGEHFVISLMDYNFFWRDSYKHEVDFISLENSEIIPVEVQYKEKIYEKEFKNLEIFSRKFNLSNALCLWKNINEEKIKLKELIIEKKPVYFL